MKHAFLLIFSILTTLFAAAQPLAVIPFEVNKSCIYFYIKVNEKDSLKFLFDTGADGCVINERSLDKLSLKVDGESLNVGSNGTNTVKLSSDNTLSLGSLVLKKVPLTIIPYETTDFDGVFGTDQMRPYVIEVDYSKKELRFHKPAAFTADLSAFTRCKLYFPGNYFSIKSSILVKGKKYSGLFGLDTGADNVLTMSSPFSSKNNLAGKTQKVGSATSQGSDGSTYESAIVLIPEVTLGELHFYRILADLATATEGGNAAEDKAGFFGNDFLKRFNMVIDIPKGSVYFKPNGNLYTPFFE